MQQKIPDYEVKFHPHSFFDPSGRLFWLNGQLYRGISCEKALFFQELFQNGLIQKLVERELLIESELTSLVIDGYEMVIRHRTLPFLSYPNEWCAATLKHAALTMIELAIELAQQGFTVVDGHPWNISIDIDVCQPVFVDLGSIVPINNSLWNAYDSFCWFCLYPLILMSDGRDRIARLLMCEDEGVIKSDLSRLTRGSAVVALKPKLSVINRLELVLRQQVPASYLKQLKQTLNYLNSFFNRSLSGSEFNSDSLKNVRERSHLNFLKKVRREVESISLTAERTEISEQYSKSSFLLSSQEVWTTKQKNLHKILTDIKPYSVLDIGCSTGWYSKLAALLGSKVVAFDIDQACITQLYYDARDNKLPILPLIMDFTKPTPARGLSNHWAIAATERFQCDMVLALALVHHIVLERRLNFDQIVEGLALFSKRWVVVEFIPREDQDAGGCWSPRTSWYTLDNFINALKKRFHNVSILPSHPEPRVLLLCEK